jgi:hypothetical protein
MERTTGRFLELLGERRARQLERRRDSACGLWPDLTIAYVNPAWHRFARENRGDPEVSERWCEGAALLEAIDRPLRAFYEEHLRCVLEGGQAWEHEYECSSPQLHRRFRLSAEPLDQGSGLLLVHSCLAARPHDERTHQVLPPHGVLYVDEDGLMTQCIHCRRMRRRGDEELWDWVPAWVTRVPDNASGGLCPACVKRWYPQLLAAPA